MQGKIVKGIAGFYYVHTPAGIYECKAKGIFRKEQIKPLVGDDVLLAMVGEEEKKGNIIQILPRKNVLIRPAVVNVDQAMIIFAIVKPDPNYNLLDRFLVTMEKQRIPCVICFNKEDIATEKELQELRKSYETCGFQVLFASAREGRGIPELLQVLQGKTTVVAGPSGVGKSSLINCICPEANMEIGAISTKIQRGKHTTRHTEIFALEGNAGSGYLMDTPGFTALRLDEMEKEELKSFYPEFIEYQDYCRFAACAHISEPGCGVKMALEQGQISRLRYQNYVKLYEELKAIRKY